MKLYQKTIKMKAIILFTINFLLLSGLMAKDGDDFEEVKTYKETVVVSDDFELEITNKHGNVVLENWDKDSVSVEVVIRVNSVDLVKIQNIIKTIEVDFDSHADYLAVTTEWLNPGRSFKADIMSLFGEQSVSVDYLVKLPKDIELDITNRYGNIRMGNFDGQLKLDLSYGNIYARKIKNGRSIKIKYGKLKIKEIEKGDIVARFSNVKIDKVGEVDLNSSSSEIEIEEVENISLKSFSDNVEIEALKNIQINSSASSIEIEKMTGFIKGNLKYGDLDIDEIENEFTTISLVVTNTDIDVTFKSDVTFKYLVELEKGKAFVIPSDGNQLKKDSKIDNVHQYEGVFSKGEVTKVMPSVNIVAKNTYLQINVE